MRIKNEGSGILFMSSDLDEILNISDYVVVFFGGKLVGHGPVSSFTPLTISQYMTAGQLFDTEDRN